MILAQERVITGVVLDGEFKGEPLIGANVTVGQGQATRGVVTDLDGKFSLNVPVNTQKVVVSYMGYKSYTLKLKQGVNNYKVTLYYADKSLDEFVVTGYQQIDRRKLTAAVTTVEISDEIVGAVKNIDQA